MMRFEGQVAVVTGGRSGIGQAVARRLEAEDARVFTAQRGADPERDWIEADFLDASSPARVVTDIIDRAGRLDVLINNAGLMQETTVDEMSLEDWDRTMRVNLTAPFLMIKAALPHFARNKGRHRQYRVRGRVGVKPHPRGLLRV